MAAGPTPPPARAQVGHVTRRTARNAAVSAGAQVTGKVGTLIWTVLAARILSESAFGAFFYALAVATLLSAVAEWGFDAVMVQRGSRDLTRLPELFSLAISWQTLIALPLFLLGGLAVAPSRPDGDARAVLGLVLLAVLLDIWSDSSRAASAAAQEQTGTAAALVLQRLATVVLAAAALLLDLGVVGLAGAFLLGSVVGAAAHLRALARLGVGFSPRGLDRASLNDFLQDTWVLGLTSVVLMAVFRLDAVLLQAFRGDEAVGDYSAAYRLLETVLFVAFALRSAVFPVLNNARTDAAVAAGLNRGLSPVGLVFLPFGAVCLVEAPAVLDLLYGGDYARDGSSSLRWLAFAPLAYGIAYLLNAGLQARHLQPQMLRAALLAVIVNVALNLALLPRFGAAGAASATTVTYAVQAVAVALLLRRNGVATRVLPSMRESLVAAAALAALLWASPLPPLVEVPLGGLVYLVLWAAMVRRRDPQQLDVLRTLVRRGSPA